MQYLFLIVIPFFFMIILVSDILAMSKPKRKDGAEIRIVVGGKVKRGRKSND